MAEESFNPLIMGSWDFGRLRSTSFTRRESQKNLGEDW